MKNRCLLPLCLLLLSATNSARAQYDADKVNKKAVSLYDKALDMSQDDVPGAIRLLRQAVLIDPNYEEAYLSLAGMHASLKDYPGAIANYEKARAIDSVYFIDFNLPYSIDLAGAGNFAAALRAVDSFLTIPTLNETSRKSGEYRQR